MQTRDEVQNGLKDVINHAVASKKNLDDARAGVTELIAYAITELQSERRLGIAVNGFSTEDGEPVMITLPTFCLPQLDNDYRITPGFDGVIRLQPQNGGTSTALLGIVIPTSNIPLINVPGVDDELTLERVAIAVTELRRSLHSDGVEG